LLSGFLQSAAYLNGDGWQPLPDMPVKLRSPCVVTIAIKSLNFVGFMIVGGQNDKLEAVKDTFLFLFDKKTWVRQKALLIEARTSFSCGRISTNSSSKEMTTIAVGGHTGDGKSLSTTEILDDSANHWRPGPELPVGIESGAMVQDWKGGVILVGGFSEHAAIDTLWRLSDVGPDAAWMRLKQKLKTPRFGHVAFYIPDSLTSCINTGKLNGF
jgi:hypothetical protein